MSQQHEHGAEAEVAGEGNTRQATPSQMKENSEKEKKEEHRSEANHANHLSILVPEQVSYESLGTSGTLKLKHFIFSPFRAFHCL